MANSSIEDGRVDKRPNISDPSSQRKDGANGEQHNGAGLLPKGRARNTSRNVIDRKNHPKLVGADLYVARLANSSSKATSDPRDGDTSPGLLLPPGLSMPTGSLHDELTCKEEKCKSKQTVIRTDPGSSCRTAVESSPCYRCVCYMHSVGIKRVFWTYSEGKWEGAKIRDLVDMLEGSESP
ncbi:hypothetical protein B0H66DRAFT_17654 [Apodospora peruviana]|uniref:Uncharacterized protein n=1 Tax=Apodospora peruviana TaxID=516989 RepID=A0AAE0IQ20_9PEZI|nr:hypothetical protein B0H66DRAFT_17654 [Apodospora peruviana]